MSTERAFPGGARLAVLITAFFETFQGTPQPNPLPPLTSIEGRYLLADSWAAFGHKVGVSRLLGLLSKHGLPASFGLSGLSAERHPALARRIADAGHEIVAHSYAQDIRVATLNEDEERRNIQRTVEAIARAAQVRPAGWISPAFQASVNTPRLLAEADFVWHGDYMDQELPYLIEIGERRLVAVPYVNDANDIRFVVRNAQPAMAYFDHLRSMVDHFSDRPDGELMVVSATVHAHVFTRGEFAPALERTLEYLRNRPGIWVARRGDLAKWCLEQAGIRGAPAG